MYDISKRLSMPLLDNYWCEHIGKPSYFNLQPDIGFTLFTPIKGRIDSLTVYIYKAETCTYILRYNTCMSSYRGDRKWTEIEP
jgi:hypothetical protein